MNNSENKYWFKLEDNGADVMPARWQGWMVVGAFATTVVLAIVLFIHATRLQLTVLPVIRLALTIGVASFVLYHVGKLTMAPQED